MHRPEIECYQIPFAKFFRRCPAVRQRAAFTAGNDRFKCIGIGAMLTLAIGNFGGKIKLPKFPV